MFVEEVTNLVKGYPILITGYCAYMSKATLKQKEDERKAYLLEWRDQTPKQ